jgi:hypothetical protein
MGIHDRLVALTSRSIEFQLYFDFKWWEFGQGETAKGEILLLRAIRRSVILTLFFYFSTKLNGQGDHLSLNTNSCLIQRIIISSSFYFLLSQFAQIKSKTVSFNLICTIKT